MSDVQKEEIIYKEDTHKEKIRMIIAGPVSAGKSTFFNALMSNTYSDMKRRKVTMLPQIYEISKNNSESAEDIYNRNRESNEEILELRESGKFDVDKHFRQLVYNIAPIDDFITLPDKKATYSILDMPGLNCGGDTLYYDYIKKISREIDVYVLVFDINSGLNTTDEITILKLVVDEIIKNKNGYVRILINKCDDIHFENDKIELGDDELNELYERCEQTIYKHCAEIKDRVTVSPLCSSKLYVYRGVKNNISTIDEKQLDNLIKTECGKTELKKLDSIKKKRKFISGLLQKSKLSLFDDWMNDTGYNHFKKKLDDVIELYPEITSYHIDMDLEKLITKQNNFDYTALVHETKAIVKRITRLSSLSENSYDPIFAKYLKTNFDNLNSLITNNMKTKILNVKARKDTKKETIDANIEKIRIALEHTNNYNKILEKVHKFDEITTLITSLVNKKNELLIFKFKNNNFNPEIFCELQQFDLIDINFFTSSVINTLKYDISYFNKIYSFLNKDSQQSYIVILLNNYIDIFIKNSKLCSIDEFDDFINSVNIITKNKKIDLSKTSVFINKYLTETNLAKYIEFWSVLNSSKISLSNETKFIYYNLSKLISKNNIEQVTNVVEEGGCDEEENREDAENEEDGDEEECEGEGEEEEWGYNEDDEKEESNFGNFNNLFNKLDLLFDTIINNTRKDNSFLDKKINYKNNDIIKVTTASPNSTIDNKDEKDDDTESCTSDLSGNTEDYADDDNSEVVYTKANKNTKKRTKNIINTTKQEIIN